MPHQSFVPPEWSTPQNIPDAVYLNIPNRLREQAPMGRFIRLRVRRRHGGNVEDVITRFPSPKYTPKTNRQRRFDPRKYNLLDAYNIGKQRYELENLDGIEEMRADRKLFLPWRGSSTNIPDRQWAVDADEPDRYYPIGAGPNDVQSEPMSKLRGRSGLRRWRSFLAAGGGRPSLGGRQVRAQDFAESSHASKDFIQSALESERLRRLSDREIARRLGVDHSTVSRRRERFGPKLREREVRRGRQRYKMRVAKIGSWRRGRRVHNFDEMGGTTLAPRRIPRRFPGAGRFMSRAVSGNLIHQILNGGNSFDENDPIFSHSRRGLKYRGGAVHAPPTLPIDYEFYNPGYDPFLLSSLDPEALNALLNFVNRSRNIYALHSLAKHVEAYTRQSPPSYSMTEPRTRDQVLAELRHYITNAIRSKMTGTGAIVPVSDEPIKETPGPSGQFIKEIRELLAKQSAPAPAPASAPTPAPASASASASAPARQELETLFLKPDLSPEELGVPKTNDPSHEVYKKAFNKGGDVSVLSPLMRDRINLVNYARENDVRVQSGKPALPLWSVFAENDAEDDDWDDGIDGDDYGDAAGMGVRHILDAVPRRVRRPWFSQRTRDVGRRVLGGLHKLATLSTIGARNVYRSANTFLRDIMNADVGSPSVNRRLLSMIDWDKVNKRKFGSWVPLKSKVPGFLNPRSRGSKLVGIGGPYVRWGK